MRVTRSLRARLLWWYTGMLAVVVLAFGAVVSYLAWRAEIADIDAALRAHAQILARGLQPVEAGTFDLVLPAGGAPEQPYHTVWTPEGGIIDRSDPALDVPRPLTQGFRTRSGRRELVIDAAGARVLVGVPLDAAQAVVANLAARMALAGAAALAVSLAGGLYLVRRALAPVTRINETARAMVDGDFAARVRLQDPDTEIGELARALNEAFDRLHAAVERQRRFTADASHELRTPLAVVSTELQWALGRERSAEEYRGSLEVCRRASTRTHAIVERLLTLARADAGAEDTEAEQGVVPLNHLAAEVVDDLRPLARARRQVVDVDAQPVSCRAPRPRLTEALSHVLMNAIQYTPDGGRIRVETRDRGSYAEVVVADTGVGIAADQLAHVFEPFFRADPARAGAPGGAGLGLAVTQAIVRRHGGTVSCDSTVGQGTTVTLRLPRDGAADAATCAVPDTPRPDHGHRSPVTAVPARGSY
jgi:signal transduction histidine kinase